MEIKRLIRLVPGSMRRVWLNVLCQWFGLLANIALVLALSLLLAQLFQLELFPSALGASMLTGQAEVTPQLTKLTLLLVAGAAFLVRSLSVAASERVAFSLAEDVKRTLRGALFDRALALGPAYARHVSTSQLVQLSAEGVEQLQTFFARFLPQLFYSLVAPLTLFVVLSFYSLKVALLLLVCVPLIPLVIMGIHRRVKRVAGKYWGSYAKLGQQFLESLQGMTTLKVYQADERRHQQMNGEAESFRKMTMRLLAVQLNSIIVMDVIAFGGAALGIALTVYELGQGQVSILGALILILLAAEYFVPLRLLGSFFHIAMNGVAASGRVFRVLDAPISSGTERLPEGPIDIRAEALHFEYGRGAFALEVPLLSVPARGLVAIVGQSGCGKSTFARLLSGQEEGYEGSLRVGGVESRDLASDCRSRAVASLSHDSFFFKGTVRENLLLARPGATDAELEQALERARLLDYLHTQAGLDTELDENASNLSGGQRQRLALARGLLHGAAVYVFDEATSNVDADHEADLIALIYALAQEKAVVLISHRLTQVTRADDIYFMDAGRVEARGAHEELLQSHAPYRHLFEYQQELERYGHT